MKRIYNFEGLKKGKTNGSIIAVKMSSDNELTKFKITGTNRYGFKAILLDDWENMKKGDSIDMACEPEDIDEVYLIE